MFNFFDTIIDYINLIIHLGDLFKDTVIGIFNMFYASFNFVLNFSSPLPFILSSMISLVLIVGIAKFLLDVWGAIT